MTFPFSIGVTSLTYPMRDLLYNLQQIPDPFDTVEITLDYPDTLPLTVEMQSRIKDILEKKELNLTIHLPLSIQMTSANPHIQDASLRSLEEAFTSTERLSPKAYVLHVSPFFLTGSSPVGRAFETERHMNRLRAAKRTLDRLRNMMDPAKIAIENLYHNLYFEEDFILEMGYSVCMDVGHLLLNKGDVYLHFNRFQDRIKVIHLHDVVDGRDHNPLGTAESQLDLDALLQLMAASEYSETVILEQFRPEHIRASYEFLKTTWHNLIQ